MTDLTAHLDHIIAMNDGVAGANVPIYHILPLLKRIRRELDCQHHDDAGGVPSAADRQERSRKPASDGCTLFDGVRAAEGRDG